VEGEAEKMKEEQIAAELGMKEYGMPALHHTRFYRGPAEEYIANQHNLIGMDFSQGRAIVYGSQGELILPADRRLSRFVDSGVKKIFASFMGIVKSFPYDQFQHMDEYAPFFPRMFGQMKRMVDERTYQSLAKIPHDDIEKGYKLVEKRLPGLLELFSACDACFFSFELGTPWESMP
jgi:hypothetical protein